ncbi:MAG: hypothetical protein IJP43_07580 [Oscillospiraceae bacterium]|nr:hypothetical protein [Oscillospiraceae bacterium]
MTPAQLQIYAKAQAEKLKTERENKNRHIYNLSVLIRQQIWSKELVEYEDVFADEEKEVDDDEFFSYICALNRQFGGEEVF